MSMSSTKTIQSGFTLVELIISIVVLGVLIVAVAPMISNAFTFREAAVRDENTLQNRKLANAMVEFSRNREGINRGRLPAPVTTTTATNLIKNGLFDPLSVTAESVELGVILRSTGIPFGQLNNDGAVVENARVYQRVSGLTYQMPLYSTTGPRVLLNYDYGVIYNTRCSRRSTCYTAAVAANPPGDSAQLTSANISSWITEGEDYGPIAFSTLEDQKTLLRITAGRLNRLADRFVVDFHNKVRLAAADSTANFFVVNNGGLNLGDLDPAANMGCRDGWYNLSAANVDVLTQLGMDKTEHGVTAWGGLIGYCRDFDPAGTSTHNAPPHYGALRIHRNTSSLVAPTVLTDAVIITF